MRVLQGVVSGLGLALFTWAPMEVFAQTVVSRSYVTSAGTVLCNSSSIIKFWNVASYTYPGKGAKRDVPDGMGGTIGVTFASNMTRNFWGPGGLTPSKIVENMINDPFYASTQPTGNYPTSKITWTSGNTLRTFHSSAFPGDPVYYSVILDFSGYKASAAGPFKDGETFGGTYLALTDMMSGFKRTKTVMTIRAEGANFTKWTLFQGGGAVGSWTLNMLSWNGSTGVLQGLADKPAIGGTVLGEDTTSGLLRLPADEHYKTITIDVFSTPSVSNTATGTAVDYPGYGVATEGALSCEAINMCATSTHGCDVNATCSFNATANPVNKCTCNSGYTGNGTAGNCADINECSTSAHNCDGVKAMCTNSNESFTCACKAGYTGAGTTSTCIDIDECSTNAHNCAGTGGVCTNSGGSFTCACDTGYAGDGLTCAVLVVTNTPETGTVTVTAAGTGTTPNSTCFSTTTSFNATVANVPSGAGVHSGKARLLFNVSTPENGGYCAYIQSPTYGHMLYNCDGGDLRLSYDAAAKTVRVAGRVARCGSVFLAHECAEAVHKGHAVCQMDFMYPVSVYGDALVAADPINGGGGTITCPNEALTYAGKQQLLTAHTFRVSATADRGQHGQGWLVFPKAMDNAGDWFFSLHC